MAKKKTGKAGMISVNQTVTENRRARFDYLIEEKLTAGIVLMGTEVKMLRLGQCSLNEAYVSPEDNEVWLINSYIPEYPQAGKHLQHESKRRRKLLVHRKEIGRLAGAVTREGRTIVPLRLFFDGKGIARVEIALAKGKKLYDKRETEKARDWNRQKGRILREKG